MGSISATVSKSQPVAILYGFYRSYPNTGVSWPISESYTEDFENTNNEGLTCKRSGTYHVTFNGRQRYCTSKLCLNNTPVAYFGGADSSYGAYALHQFEIDLELEVGDLLTIYFDKSTVDDRGQVVNYAFFRI